MSRTGKRPIAIPTGTEVSVQNHELIVKGKNGTLKRAMHPNVAIDVEGGNVTVSPKGSSRLARALWGTYAAHVRNMVAGVNTPFTKKLQIEGIGFKAELAGKTLKMALGYSHPVIINIPEGLTAVVEKNMITVTGADKDAVGQFAASVRNLRKPEPYKGKGIRYEGEVIRMKQGKKAAGA